MNKKCELNVPRMQRKGAGWEGGRGRMGKGEIRREGRVEMGRGGKEWGREG